MRLRRPRDQATLHFFWLCVAFFGAFSFSFNGPFDRLDWVFYWGDAVAIVLLPPLLLHFTLEFPERPLAARPSAAAAALVPLMYLPALGLIAARIVAIARASSNGPLFSRAIDLLDRAEHLYLFVGSLAAILVLFRAFRQITSRTGRRQLRWIAWGTALGVGPFAFFYALPWALGVDPPLALQLTAIPLGLVPLTFASAIVRYRLRDVEVIIKRGLAYTAFGAAALILYAALLKLVRLLVRQRHRRAQLDRRGAGDARHRPARAAGEGRACRRRSIACSIAIGTTTAAPWSASRATSTATSTSSVSASG